MKDYKKYNDYRQKIIKYRSLVKLFPKFEEGTEEWNYIHNNENSGLTIQKRKIPKRILYLTLPNLSIEQWSFLKSLYTKLNDIDFIELVCSLSENFLQELNISSSKTRHKEQNIYNPVKIKYMDFCNKVVNNQVKFI